MQLSARDVVVLKALLPAGEEAAVRVELDPSAFEVFLGELQEQAPLKLWRAFRLGLLTAAWLAPLLVGRPPPIDRLSPDSRERALRAMAESRVPELRQLVTVLKSVVSLHYGGLPSVRKEIGYP